jgi:chemotaxis protein CheC
VTPRLTEVQLDALRELANIASGTAATALSQMLGQEVEISVPCALTLPFADAVEACGPADEVVTGIVIPLEGEIEGLVLLLIPNADADNLCTLLGVEPGSDVAESALCEIGNIVGTSYLNGISAMTGMYLGPRPPHVSRDMIGAIVASLLAQTAEHSDTALMLDSELDLQQDPCSISFMLLPTSGGVGDLLAPLGLAD